jgi:hypothetical protein
VAAWRGGVAAWRGGVAAWRRGGVACTGPRCVPVPLCKYITFQLVRRKLLHRKF